MADIFISYNHKDRAVAEKLAQELRANENGWGIFYDRETKGGAEWSNVLLEKLGIARCVIVLWSTNSKDSLWVQGEAANAYEKGIYLPI